MVDVGLGDGGGDDLRPDAKAGEGLVHAADLGEAQVDVVAAFLEFLFQLDGAGAADGVGGGADVVGDRVHGSRAWAVLVVVRLAAEGVFVFFGRHALVVEAVDAVVVAVEGAAMADPDDVPFVAVGEDAGALWGFEGPVYEALGGGRYTLHDLFDAEIPVGIALDD